MSKGRACSCSQPIRGEEVLPSRAPRTSKKVWYAACCTPGHRDATLLLPVYSCPGKVEFTAAVAQRRSKEDGMLVLPNGRVAVVIPNSGGAMNKKAGSVASACTALAAWTVVCHTTTSPNALLRLPFTLCAHMRYRNIAVVSATMSASLAWKCVLLHGPCLFLCVCYSPFCVCYSPFSGEGAREAVESR
jgi:hypothetical protein